MSDIKKEAIYDGRILQKEQEVYAVEKGGLSITNVPYTAIATSSSQSSWNIQVPSTSVFVGRDLMWSSNVFFSFTSTNVNAQNLNDPVWTFGADGSVVSFPLNRLCQSLQATINDTTVITNLGDVINEMIRMVNQKKNRLSRTCPTALDRYARYADAFGASNNPLAGYADAWDMELVGNGSWANVAFTTPTGALLAPNAVPAFAGAGYNTNAQGVPVYPGATLPGVGLTLYCRLFSTERLLLSPFIFSEECDGDTGMFGIQNIQILAQHQSALTAKLLRANQISKVASALALNNLPSGSPFSGSVINANFITPSLEVPLPSKSVVPFMEYPRYIQTQATTVPGAVFLGSELQAGSATLASQTISLPLIPDYLVVYAKPASNADLSLADSYLPISNISLNFDNYSGLMNSMSREQNYEMCLRNGLELDYNTWRGAVKTTVNGCDVQSVGSFLVIKPGIDFALASGLACGVLGKFTLQIQATVQNFSTVAVANPSLTILTINSGFLESSAGMSRVLKGILSQKDVVDAENSWTSTNDVKRLVGAGFFDTLGSLYSKAKDLFSKGKNIYEKTKPIGTAIKNVLPEGHVAREIMGHLGYAKRGSAYSGAGVSGSAMDRC